MNTLIDGAVKCEWWKNLLDVLLFKVSWILLVLFHEMAIIPVVLINAWKLLLIPFRGRDLWLILLVFLIGILLDTALLMGGVLVFNSVFLPAWLIILWLSFAITLPGGFGFILNLPVVLQSLCAAVAGGVGYSAGLWLDAVSFGRPLPVALVILACCWAVLIPGAIHIAGRLHKRGMLR